MLDAEDEMAAGNERPKHFADKPAKVLHVMKSERAIGEIEGLLRQVEAFQIGAEIKTPGSAVSALARASMFSDRSTPSTWAAPWLIAHRANQPKPQPRSTIRFPRNSGSSFWIARHSGPRPIRARTDPSGCSRRRIGRIVDVLGQARGAKVAL